MYFYIYDEIANESKHEREIRLIENRLTDLDITGKIGRLSLFRDPTNFIKDAIKAGATTIIAVGTDSTLRKIIDSIKGSEIVLGIIPLTKEDNKIANILGVPLGVAACDTLSKRIVEKLDIGLVSGMRFLHEAKIQVSDGMKIKSAGWTIEPPVKSVIEIRNMAAQDSMARAADPTDGRVDIVIRPTWRKFFKKDTLATVIPVKDAQIISKKTVDLIIDGEVFEGERFDISVLPGEISLITGGEKIFDIQ
ncbi:hypothetical protein KJ766_02970 [Patescibacteria group bacterium]|nr:hypothetical protein [Patescibacteria group bacterium]